MDTLRVEKERYKEAQYMSLYKDLFRKNRGLFQQQRDAADFADEATLLKEAISSQRQAWLAGIGIGLMTFASLHYLPNYLIRSLGGEAKIKALDLAEQQSKKDGTAWIRKLTGLVVEGSFSVWTGYCAYHRAAEQSKDVYEMIAKVPLCAGRSAVAEAVCDEWVDTTRERIPQLFWQNLQEAGTLRDERAWKAIRQFSDNCIRRRHYEAYLRQKSGKTLDPKVPIPLPRKVPDYNSDAFVNNKFSKTEAETLVADRK
jgi:hypothetical protein